MKKPVLEWEIQDIENIESLDEAKVVIAELLTLVKQLAAKLGTDSSNSSKPSSQDSYKKPDPKSQRGKSGKKPGGQRGHKGSTRKNDTKPDQIIKVQGEGAIPGNKMQVIDLVRSTKVTEFQFGHEDGIEQCSLPPYLTGRIQYGPCIKAMVVYLLDEGAMSCERVSDFMSEAFGLQITASSCKNAETSLAGILVPWVEFQKKKCLGEELLHADETGARCNGKNYRVHTIANEFVALYFAHEKRGKQAIIDQAVLTTYNGILVSDHWCGYNACSNVTHAYCNAHHLRELQRLVDHEDEGKEWAKLMQAHLKKCKKMVECYKLDDHKKTPSVEYTKLFNEYMSIILMGLASYPVTKSTGKRGRPKQKKGKNLLDRLHQLADGVLLFVKNFKVPFDNNLAERVIRMVKTKMKVIGCFRSETGIQNYCTIRSYIKTIKQRGMSVFGCVREAFELGEKLVII